MGGRIAGSPDCPRIGFWGAPRVGIGVSALDGFLEASDTCQPSQEPGSLRSKSEFPHDPPDRIRSKSAPLGAKRPLAVASALGTRDSPGKLWTPGLAENL
jgi:hypothetical protein